MKHTQKILFGLLFTFSFWGISVFTPVFAYNTIEEFYFDESLDSTNGELLGINSSYVSTPTGQGIHLYGIDSYFIPYTQIDIPRSQPFTVAIRAKLDSLQSHDYVFFAGYHSGQSTSSDRLILNSLTSSVSSWFQFRKGLVPSGDTALFSFDIKYYKQPLLDQYFTVFLEWTGSVYNCYVVLDDGTLWTFATNKTDATGLGLKIDKIGGISGIDYFQGILDHFVVYDEVIPYASLVSLASEIKNKVAPPPPSLFPEPNGLDGNYWMGEYASSFTAYRSPGYAGSQRPTISLQDPLIEYGSKTISGWETTGYFDSSSYFLLPAGTVSDPLSCKKEIVLNPVDVFSGISAEFTYAEIPPDRIIEGGTPETKFLEWGNDTYDINPYLFFSFKNASGTVLKSGSVSMNYWTLPLEENVLTENISGYAILDLAEVPLTDPFSVTGAVTLEIFDYQCAVEDGKLYTQYNLELAFENLANPQFYSDVFEIHMDTARQIELFDFSTQFQTTSCASITDVFEANNTPVSTGWTDILDYVSWENISWTSANVAETMMTEVCEVATGTTFKDLIFSTSNSILETIGMDDLFYSFVEDSDGMVCFYEGGFSTPDNFCEYYEWRSTSMDSKMMDLLINLFLFFAFLWFVKILFFSSSNDSANS